MAGPSRSHPGLPLRSAVDLNDSMRRGPPEFGLLEIISTFQMITSNYTHRSPGTDSI